MLSVPSTNHTATLEDMSYIFGRRMREHALAQAKRLWPRSKVTGPKLQWQNVASSASGSGAAAHHEERAPTPQMTQNAPDKYVLAQTNRVPSSK